jgi:hypothetical protein
MYTMLCIRLNVTYTLRIMTRYRSSLGEGH